MGLVVTLPEEYRGKFITRVYDKIIAVADTIEEVLEETKKRGYDPRDVVVDYVPEEDIILVL